MLSKAYLFADRDWPAEVEERSVSLTVNSSGSNIFGQILLPALAHRDALSPVVLMLHGYPGTEKNTDIACALRRAGLAVIQFSYRGVWGSHGEYRFSHLTEDTTAVLDYLKNRAEEYRLDMDQVCLFGHSMGGFTALHVLAGNRHIRGAVVAAPCDMGWLYRENPEGCQAILKSRERGYFHLPYPESLEEELEVFGENWQFVNLCHRISAPVHFIGGSKDVKTPPQQHILPLYERMAALGMEVSCTMLEDGHAFPVHRIALTNLVFDKIRDILDSSS